MSNVHRKHGLPAAKKAGRPVPVDLARFEPQSAFARSKVDELIKRGAVVIAVRAALVTLKRAGQTARIDSWGRVEWAH
jgi:carotenoid cleavage dioxygenase-like enzyme